MNKGFDYFKSDDGLAIRYCIWLSQSDETVGSVVYLHGRAEFIEKNAETIDELNARGFDVYTLDWRGQGLSDRMLEDRHRGYVKNYSQYISDLRRFVEQLVISTAKGPLFLLAHSMGGHIALRYLHDCDHPFIGAVLLSPMIDIRIYPVADRMVRLLSRMAVVCGADEKYVFGASGYDPNSKRFANNPLTGDRKRFLDEVRLIDKNPDLALGGVTFGWLQASFESIDILKSPDYLEKIDIPVLMISGERDRVVCRSSQIRACRRLPKCIFVDMKGARHEILKETDEIRSEFWRHFDAFVS